VNKFNAINNNKEYVMSHSFEGKTVLLTGASSGIGKATALRFAEAGANLVLAARRQVEGEQVAVEARALGVEAVFVQTDVSDPAACRALIGAAVDKFGAIDVACNNAGIEGEIVPITEYSDAAYQQVMDVNVNGTWFCMQAEIAQMKQQAGGAIVNVGSVAGLIGFPGMAPYSASKHAMVGLTKTAAIEIADDNIRVNIVCPALIDTVLADRFTGGKGTDTEEYIMSLTPMRRRGTPAEVAELILWLSSDAASYVTGASYPVDGGLLTI
jgi:NAD(P)-dependent dehydrogenase (short-subunit alcohol dehydrogenase family)